MRPKMIKLRDNTEAALVLVATTFGYLERCLNQQDLGVFEGLVAKSRDSNYSLSESVELILKEDHIMQGEDIHPAIRQIVINCLEGDKLLDAKLVHPILST